MLRQWEQKTQVRYSLFSRAVCFQTQFTRLEGDDVLLSSDTMCTHTQMTTFWRNVLSPSSAWRWDSMFLWCTGINLWVYVASKSRSSLSSSSSLLLWEPQILHIRFEVSIAVKIKIVVEILPDAGNIFLWNVNSNQSWLHSFIIQMTTVLTCNLCSLKVTDNVSQPHKTAGKMITFLTERISEILI
jgi:hypothetical protein